jgi:hypothetical protein
VQLSEDETVAAWALAATTSSAATLVAVAHPRVNARGIVDLNTASAKESRSQPPE